MHPIQIELRGLGMMEQMEQIPVQITMQMELGLEKTIVVMEYMLQQEMQQPES